MVKTYGGIGRNHTDGGVLIGDAGSFVDPMTGEGITPGMESALIAASTIVQSFEQGRFDAAFLSRFERDFRGYFDPAMLYLDLCAADPVFARVAGSTFGGLEVRPSLILAQVWSRIFGDLSEGGAQIFLGFLSARFDGRARLIGDFGAWQRGWWRSLIDDPLWTASWLADVAKKATSVQATLWASDNPRVRGISL